ncbi:NAD(P)-binding domain protein [Akanthomyces lecanii RCEF 1005]|uniref:NAD(P)-binding domain protein n=1 Tax=Akanthomyces lecanii RCEF 1005 TaxID=1081108 RepID=A0A168KHP4_CORDF|nr:NAD(P)-binding domain protein [Akanthomyces lecanii RCEF 1005]
MSQVASGMSPGTFTTPSRPLRWLITGCSSGLGLALARYAQSQGHYVIATSRNPSKTPELAAEIERDGKKHGRWVQLDVTDPDSGAVIKMLEEEDGLPIDVLVSNAAASVHTVVEAFTEDEVQKQMEVLYLGPFRLIRAAVPYMRRRRFGIVVNISTGAALEGRESMGTYASGKAATDELEAMIKVLAKEVAEFNIRTLTVHLGSFNTNMPTAAASGSAPLPGDYKDSIADQTINVMQDGPFVPRGDKDKAVRQIFDVALGRGAGKGHEGEFFLPLGEEMPARIKLVRDRLDHCLAVYGDVCTSVGLDVALD